MIVGEAWGQREQQYGEPFVGQSGEELTKMLAEAGIARNQCFLTNVINERPPGNEMWRFFKPTQEAKKAGALEIRGLFPEFNVLCGLDLLREQIRLVQPKLIIAFGNYALWALTEDSFSIGNNKKRKVPTGITSWRGSQLFTSPDMGNIPLLPTYHPAAIMRKWEWRSVAVHDLRSRASRFMQNELEWSPPPYNFRIRPSLEQACETLDMLIREADKHNLSASKDKLILAVDLETWQAHIACIGIAWTKYDAICIPIMWVENDAGYWLEDCELIIVRRIRELLTHPNVRIVGQNFLYDAQYLAFWGIFPKMYMDTMLAQHLCWPGTPKGLDYISSLYCDYHCYWKDEGKEWNRNIPEDRYWVYNCRDAVATFESAGELSLLIAELQLMPQWHIQMRQFYMILKMMLRGVRIDRKRKGEVAGELLMRIQDYEAWFMRHIGPEVWTPPKNAKPWYGSPQQLGQIVYDVLGIKEVKNRKTGSRTTDDEALEIIKKREPLLKRLCTKLQEFRSLGVFYSTFAMAKLDADNRMRCSFSPTAETFRWTSSKNAFGTGANLQNIPKGKEEK